MLANVKFLSVVLPASAGMIPISALQSGEDNGAPRIRGDDPMGIEYYDRDAACSPHPRG